MSEANPVFRSITGEGKPRIRVRKPTNAWASYNTTTYTATTVTEAMSGTVVVTSSAAADDSVTFNAAHGLALGDRVLIAGHSGSTPSLNAEWTVTKVYSSVKIGITCNITTGGSGGTGRKVPNFTKVRAGMAVVASKTRASLSNLPVYGRITNTDSTNKILTVAEWIGGTPNNTDTYVVNGWIVDLPYCQQLTQRFAPEQLVHELYRKRKASRFYGYQYEATVDYSAFASADMLYLLDNVLNCGEDDALILTPYVDKAWQYNVLLNQPLSLGLFGIAGGHRGVKLVFEGKDLVAFPATGSGYGFSYALYYGTGL